MFYMLTCFNLNSDVSIDDFSQSLDQYMSHMKSRELVHSTSGIGSRHSDIGMDTDSERDHRYFFTTNFVDRPQCEKAVEYIQAHEEPSLTLHKAVYSRVSDPVFICYADI